ncbi:MAG TPA: DUF4760 domain-containing protein [Allosphingosinicella sp.]|jgi:hypothetical protein
MVAILGIRNVRRIARERATLDLIEKVESDTHYRAVVDGFYKAVDEKAFGRASSPTTEEDRELRRCVLAYLNHYEIVCIGIRRQVLDEGFYRTWMEAPLVQAWNDSAGWIQQERWKRQEDGSWTYYPKHFENLEWAARRWSPQAERLSEGWAAPIVTGGPGDVPLPESTVPPLRQDEPS